ncbi:MAG: hypothetical protein H6704_00890 [Myxococcales bacterium]|nr:hypothetical protein [Myxococcales bacterium]
MTPFVRSSLTPPHGMYALGERDDPLDALLPAAPSPLLPDVVIDLLRGRIAAGAEGLQAALESDPALREATCIALGLDDPRTSSVARGLARWGVEHVTDRMLEAALVRRTLQRGGGRPAGTGPMLRRHLWGCAGAARALARAEGLPPAAVREAQVAAALHRVGIETFEAHVRLFGPTLTHRLTRDDLDLEVKAERQGVCVHRLAARVLLGAGLPRRVSTAVAWQGEPRRCVEALRLGQARRAAHLAGFPADGPQRSVPSVPGEGVAGASEAVDRGERLARAIAALTRAG